MKKLYLIVLFISLFGEIYAQQSIARRWNEVQLKAIREDRTKVPMQARNLFHTAIALYDCWALYDSIASPFLIGNTYSGVAYPISSIAPVSNITAAQEEAMSYAAYRVLKHEYSYSPNSLLSIYRFDTLMSNLGYDPNYTSTNYSTGLPADLGNWVAQQIISMKYTDGANESGYFGNTYYGPLNPSLSVTAVGNPSMLNPNRWQPLSINGALDQNGNPIPSIQIFDAAEWGHVTPFALLPSQRITFFRNGYLWPVYLNPGPPPMLDTVNVNNPSSQLFKWGHSMVSIWSSTLDPNNDSTLWDISPGGIGNIPLSYLPISGQQTYYRYILSGDTSTGHAFNPATGLPYTPNVVKLGDYARVVSQFWADGPTSETPPGHWFTFLNMAADHPSFVRKFRGVGPELSKLEYDVKAYFSLGSAMHDAAIVAWGIKGYYDSPRPISAIRKMASYGQSTSSALPSYHPGGLPLVNGFIELIDSTDALAGAAFENVNKIKLKAWYGFDSISNPTTDFAGVGWILAEKWMPYQRASFVSPPFAGYVSGHSTYSRAGSEVLTKITGNPYFPGGMASYTINQSQNFLVFEQGPSTPSITLQWATYRDASNEASLSRIWGGIHPPFDDMYGRVAGEIVGNQAIDKAQTYFYSAYLPVHLTKFEAREQNCSIVLNWETAQEENSKKFEIWHSTDGFHYDDLLGTVLSAGNSTTTKKYQFTHRNPDKNNYYKLVEIDIENKESTKSFLGNVSTHCDGDQTIKLVVAPNPCHNLAGLSLNQNTDYITQYSIMDISGRVLFNGQNAIPEQQTLALSFTNLPAANYIVSARTQNGLSLNTLVIKK